MNKAREKAIKLYWKTAKERCPFQEEEMANSFLEGFIDCAEYLLPLIEKMKCCGNCKKLRSRFDHNTHINILYCSDSDMKQIEVGFQMCCCKWEIKEK